MFDIQTFVIRKSRCILGETYIKLRNASIDYQLVTRLSTEKLKLYFCSETALNCMKESNIHRCFHKTLGEKSVKFLDNYHSTHLCQMFD